MKSSIGQCLELILFGESHSASIGAVLNGMPAGVAGKDIQNHQPQIAVAEKTRPTSAALVFVSHSIPFILIYLNYI